MDYKNKSDDELMNELKEMKEKYDSLKNAHDLLVLESKKKDGVLADYERLHYAYEFSAVGFCYVDLKGRFTSVNKAFEQLLGYTNEELRGLAFNNITHPDDLSIGSTHMTSLIANKIAAASFEKRYIRKDGQVFYALTTVSLIKDSKEAPLYFFTQIQDITDRKGVELELQNSKQKYYKIFDRAPVLISLTDFKTGVYVDVNDFALSFSGFSREEVIGKKSTEIGWISIENRNILANKLIEKGRIDGLEMEFKTSSGSTVYGLVNGEKITLNGKDYLLTITTDVTERKQYEHLLQGKNNEIEAQNEELNQANLELLISKETAEESEKQLKKAQQTAKVGNWVWYIQENRLWWSDEMYNIFEVDKETFTGQLDKVIEEAIHPDDKAVVDQSNFSVMVDNKPVPVEYRIKTKDGSLKYVLGLADNVVLDEHGKSKLLTGIVKDITDYKQIQIDLVKAKERAEESEQKLQFIFETVSEGIALNECIYNDRGEMIDYRIRDVNKAFYEIADYKGKSAIGSYATQLYGMTEDNIKSFWEEHSKRNTILFSEYQSPLNKKWFYVSASPIVDDKFITAFFDITPRKQLEKALQESELKFRTAFMTGTNANVIVGRDNGIIVEVNDRMLELYGYTREEFVGHHTHELGLWVYPEERQIMIEKLRENGRIYNMEVLARRKNGETFWVLYSVNEIASDEEPLILGSILDITDIKQAQSELIQAKEKAEENEQIQRLQKEEIAFSNERLESLLRIAQYQTDSIQELLDFALNEAIKLTYSKIGYIYFYNETNQRFTLNTWSKDVMKECMVLNPETVYDLNKTGCWGEAVRQRKPIIMNNYQAANPLKKGVPHGHVQLKKFLTIPVIFENKIVAVVGVANKVNDYDNSDVRQLTLLMDSVWKISERILLVKDLISSKEKAEESDRLKTAFLQNLSHEIRTPMNAIMGFSELIVSKYDDKPKLEYYAKIIGQRCKDLLVIIDDILDIAKIESGQLQVKNEKCNVDSLFKELTLFFTEQQNRLNKQHIEFVMQVHGSQSKLMIETDKVKLKQILINLIGNAFKFTDNGLIEGGCRIDGSDKLIFYVSDTGLGIPQEKHQLIFERFMQIDPTPNRLYGGTGLGLTIVKGLVTLLGGSIWLESEVGKGSTFYFSIPYKSADILEPEPKDEEKNIEIHLQNKTILVVEDDAYNTTFIQEILSDTGLNILYTQYGNEAIQMATLHSIDLVIMDIGLPDISGYEATRLIKEQKPSLKIIAQTAYAAPEDRIKALKAGCVDYISKPLKSNALIALIAKHIS